MFTHRQDKARQHNRLPVRVPATATHNGASQQSTPSASLLSHVVLRRIVHENRDEAIKKMRGGSFCIRHPHPSYSRNKISQYSRSTHRQQYPPTNQLRLKRCGRAQPLPLPSVPRSSFCSENQHPVSPLVTLPPNPPSRMPSTVTRTLPTISGNPHNRTYSPIIESRSRRHDKRQSRHLIA